MIDYVSLYKSTLWSRWHILGSSKLEPYQFCFKIEFHIVIVISNIWANEQFLFCVLWQRSLVISEDPWASPGVSSRALAPFNFWIYTFWVFLGALVPFMGVFGCILPSKLNIYFRDKMFSSYPLHNTTNQQCCTYILMIYWSNHVTVTLMV